MVAGKMSLLFKIIVSALLGGFWFLFSGIFFLAASVNTSPGYVIGPIISYTFFLPYTFSGILFSFTGYLFSDLFFPVVLLISVGMVFILLEGIQLLANTLASKTPYNP